MEKFRSWNYLVAACLILVLIAGTLLAGCTEPEPTTPEPTTPASTTPAPTTPTVTRSILECPQADPDPNLVPEYGGTLKLIYANNPTNLGAPWLLNSPFDGHMNRYPIEGLTGLNAVGNPVPQLATSWESDPENMTITYTIREGVKFHDGTPFNAEAVKWNLEMNRDGEQVYLQDVTTVDLVGDNQVRLTFSAWDPLFVLGMSSATANDMVSPTAYEELGEDGMKLHPVGTGPFKFVEFVPNVSLKYESFDDYWQEGLPYLDGVEVSFVADKVVALTSFQKGEADALYGIQTIDAQDLQDQGNKINKTMITIMGICGDSVNPDSVWANIDFRRAIAYAIDYETLVNAIYHGLFPATNQLAVEGWQGYNPSIKGYPYDPEKAKALLAPLGYTTATPLEIDFVYGTDPERTDLFTLVQYALAKVGINLNMVPLDRTSHSNVSFAGWENQLLQSSFSYNGFEMQWSTSAQNHLASNKTRYVSVETPPGFNDMLDSALAESDLGQRELYYQQMNQLVIDDYCMVVPLFAMSNFTAVGPQLHDYGFSDGTSGEFLPERAWLSK